MPIKPSQLDSLGASLVENEVVFTATDSTDSTDNTLCVLNNKGFVSIDGPDAEKFMQGQLSCDVAEISESLSSLGSHCTPKGRALASFRLVQTADQQFLFGLPENNTDTLRNSLAKYIVFSKAKLSAVQSLVALGLQGEKAAVFISQHFDAELSVGGTTTSNNGIAVCVAENRFELWLNETQLEAIWPSLSQEFTATNTDAWYRANIDAGLVEIEAATSDALVPQMFKLEEHGGISFSKGCYTGQEIIARLKYLGKQKRQLTKFTYSEGKLNIADKVETSDGKNLGLVVALSSTSGLAVVSDQTLSNAMVSGTTIVFEHGE